MCSSLLPRVKYLSMKPTDMRVVQQLALVYYMMAAKRCACFAPMSRKSEFSLRV